MEWSGSVIGEVKRLYLDRLREKTISIDLTKLRAEQYWDSDRFKSLAYESKTLEDYKILRLIIVMLFSKINRKNDNQYQLSRT